MEPGQRAYPAVILSESEHPFLYSLHVNTVNLISDVLSRVSGGFADDNKGITKFRVQLAFPGTANYLCVPF